LYLREIKFDHTTLSLKVYEIPILTHTLVYCHASLHARTQISHNLQTDEYSPFTVTKTV